jgi:hypothetical protein
VKDLLWDSVLVICAIKSTMQNQTEHSTDRTNWTRYCTKNGNIHTWYIVVCTKEAAGETLTASLISIWLYMCGEFCVVAQGRDDRLTVISSRRWLMWMETGTSAAKTNLFFSCWKVVGRKFVFFPSDLIFSLRQKPPNILISQLVFVNLSSNQLFAMISS